MESSNQDGGNEGCIIKETTEEQVTSSSSPEITAHIPSGDRYTKLRSDVRMMVGTWCSRASKLGCSLAAMWMRFYSQTITPWVARTLRPVIDGRWLPWWRLRFQFAVSKLRRVVNQMIGPLEKGMEAARVHAPVQGVYEGVDLKVLPKYISFKAALLANRLTQQYVILVLSAVLVIVYGFSRTEIVSLQKLLRTKEVILAPVQDFTTAAPQSVPDSYVANAVSDYLSLLGSVAASNIEENYNVIMDSMSPELRIKFQAEAADWKAKVKAENISEILSITQKEIVSDGGGYYKVTALGKRDTYVANEYIGHTDEAIEMTLALAPPKTGKRWYLQITELSRQSVHAFRSKEQLGGK